MTSRVDGKKVYGHMDYGKKDPSGWRFTDAWLSMAGAADKGPTACRWTSGASAWPTTSARRWAPRWRGGAANSPAAVYALTKYVDWMKKYAPQQAMGMTFSESGPVPAQGQVAQQIFWYTAFTADMTKKGLPVVNDDSTPWRMAPSPYGPYWKDGMQNGYQDVGSWTFFKSTDPKRMAAAWLYAQFVTAKTVSLKKSITGLTFIRDSDIHSEFFTKNAANYGRLIEFYRSPARGGLDAHRQQRARLPQAGPAVVEERRHRRDRREDAAGRHGQPGQRDGPGDGAPGAGGHGAVRA